MAARNPKRKEPDIPAVELAVGVVEGNPNPLDADMSGVDPSPVSLDLEDGQETEMCLNTRRSRPAEDACIVCGWPPCDDCACDGPPWNDD